MSSPSTAARAEVAHLQGLRLGLRNEYEGYNLCQTPCISYDKGSTAPSITPSPVAHDESLKAHGAFEISCEELLVLAGMGAVDEVVAAHGRRHTRPDRRIVRCPPQLIEE